MERKQAKEHRDIVNFALSAKAGETETLISFGQLLRNESIQINIDNYGAVRILTIGSSKEFLHEIALEI